MLSMQFRSCFSIPNSPSGLAFLGFCYIDYRKPRPCLGSVLRYQCVALSFGGQHFAPNSTNILHQDVRFRPLLHCFQQVQVSPCFFPCSQCMALSLRRRNFIFLRGCRIRQCTSCRPASLRALSTLRWVFNTTFPLRIGCFVPWSITIAHQMPLRDDVCLRCWGSPCSSLRTLPTRRWVFGIGLRFHLFPFQIGVSYAATSL